MKRYLQLAAVAALALSLASCDALDKLLSVNLFATKFEVNASDIQGMSLAELERMTESPSFMEALAEDPTLVAAVTARMDAIISDSGSSPAQVQAAAAVAASVLIETTAAPKIINGIVAEFASGGANLPSDETEIVDFIEGLLPPELYTNGVLDEAAFTLMIDNLILANDYYVSMGDSIGTDGVKDVNIGAAAQNAVIAAFVAGVQPVTGPPALSPGEVLYKKLNGDVITVVFDPPDLNDPVFDYLENILDAAGLNLTF